MRRLLAMLYYDSQPILLEAAGSSSTTAPPTTTWVAPVAPSTQFLGLHTKEQIVAFMCTLRELVRRFYSSATGARTRAQFNSRDLKSSVRTCLRAFMQYVDLKDVLEAAVAIHPTLRGQGHDAVGKFIESKAAEWLTILSRNELVFRRVTDIFLTRKGRGHEPIDTAELSDLLAPPPPPPSWQ
jgi:hypothetical protein